MPYVQGSSLTSSIFALSTKFYKQKRIMAGFNLLSNDIGIDLGTANTLVYTKDEVVISEPSVVAVYNNSKKSLLSAKKLRGCWARHLAISQP